MFNWRTKLEKFECLKKRGRSSLPNASWLGTDGVTRTGKISLHSIEVYKEIDSPKNESPPSDQ